MVSVSRSDSPAKLRLKKLIIDLNDGADQDFSESYLNSLSTERLRHILLYVQTMKLKKNFKSSSV